MSDVVKCNSALQQTHNVSTCSNTQHVTNQLLCQANKTTYQILLFIFNLEVILVPQAAKLLSTIMKMVLSLAFMEVEGK